MCVPRLASLATVNANMKLDKCNSSEGTKHVCSMYPSSIVTTLTGKRLEGHIVCQHVHDRGSTQYRLCLQHAQDRWGLQHTQCQLCLQHTWYPISLGLTAYSTSFALSACPISFVFTAYSISWCLRRTQYRLLLTANLLSLSVNSIPSIV